MQQNGTIEASAQYFYYYFDLIDVIIDRDDCLRQENYYIGTRRIILLVFLNLSHLVFGDPLDTHGLLGDARTGTFSGISTT